MVISPDEPRARRPSAALLEVLVLSELLRGEVVEPIGLGGLHELKQKGPVAAEFFGGVSQGLAMLLHSLQDKLLVGPKTLGGESQG